MNSEPHSCVGVAGARQNTYVYLVARRFGVELQAPVKIGVTDDLRGEVTTLQACCPFEVTLVHAVRFPDGLVLANLLQGKFDDQHSRHALGRGWFELEPATALTGLLVQLDAILATNGILDAERELVLDYLDAGSEAQAALQFLAGCAGAIR